MPASEPLMVRPLTVTVLPTPIVLVANDAAAEAVLNVTASLP